VICVSIFWKTLDGQAAVPPQPLSILQQFWVVGVPSPVSVRKTQTPNVVTRPFKSAPPDLVHLCPTLAFLPDHEQPDWRHWPLKVNIRLQRIQKLAPLASEARVELSCIGCRSSSALTSGDSGFRVENGGPLANTVPMRNWVDVGPNIVA